MTKKLNPNWAFCFCDFETNGIDKESLPIEVGCIWTDVNLVILKTYEALTKWGNIQKKDWYTPKVMGAYNIHKIQWEEYHGNGVTVECAAANISRVNQQLLKKYDRIILISDNAKFETRHMEKMYYAQELKWDFHYCTWDSSTLLYAAGVGDPEPEHRAFRDAALLHKAMIEAMDRTRHLRNG